MIAAIKDLHKNNLFMGTLNTSMIRFDDKTALYIDLIWTIQKEVKFVHAEAIDAIHVSYMGRLTSLQLQN